MQIYRLRRNTNLKEIGAYPQVETAIYPIDTDSPDFSDRIWFEKVDLKRFVFPKPILVKRAKLTDYISCSIIGTSFKMLISTKLKEILEDSLHREMQFIPATIIYKGEENRDYWFTNHYNFSQDIIDFEKCTIEKKVWKGKQSVNTTTNISSCEDYARIEKLLNPNLSIRIKYLVLKTPIHEEFFTLDRVDGGIGYYVNEQLKMKIEASGCTGIQFMGINDPI